MYWEILDTGEATAKENMQLDVELLQGLQKTPILHFYEWKNQSATYGYFLKPQNFINLEQAEQRGLDLARRSTGGGVVFHLWDMAFSVLVPSSAPFFSMNTLENYAFVHQAVLNAIKKFLNISCDLIPEDAPQLDPSCGMFCMAQPTKYDLIFQGKKIAGAAQRKQKQGYLHQGTIALCMPDKEFLNAILWPGSRIYEAMETYTYPLLGNKPTAKDLREAKYALRHFLTIAFKESYE